MTEDKQALVMLGEVLGTLRERARTDQEFREALRRIEDKLSAQLDEQGKRIGSLELDVRGMRATEEARLKESMKHGAIGGGSASAAILAAIEVAKRLLVH